MKSLTLLITGVFLWSVAPNCALAEYKLVKTIPVAGDGRWDYLTVDVPAHRLYVPRTTHTQVIDTESGKVVSDWPDTAGVHGVALVPDKSLAFTSDGRSDSVGVFDVSANKKIADVKVGTGPDAIIFDEASGKVLAMNHRGGTVTLISIDAEKKFPTQEVQVGGALEFAVIDAMNHAFVNVEDKNEVVEIDTKDAKVMNRWPITGGDGPTGLAIDRKDGRLFVGCGGNNKLIVMDTHDGKILATLPIGPRCDGVAYDSGTGDAFAACGDGTIADVRETRDNEFAVVQTIKTKPGARTIAVDEKSHLLYLPTAEFEPAEQGKRPAMKPGSFQILIVGPAN